MRIRYLLLFVALFPVFFSIGRWVFALVMALVNGKTERCPKCGSRCTRWSMRRTSDQFLPAFVLPRRCDFCNGRFYVGRSVNYIRRSHARTLEPKPAEPKLVPATQVATPVVPALPRPTISMALDWAARRNALRKSA